MRERIPEFFSVPLNGFLVEGTLQIPEQAEGAVLFACTSSRRDWQATFLANLLPQNSLATILADLLTPEEDALYEDRLNMELIGERLAYLAGWTREQQGLRNLPLGLFGIGTSGSSALELAASLRDEVCAVVAWNGRPDLVHRFLKFVTAPTLLIVGEKDELIRELNVTGYERVQTEKELLIISDATHTFEEAGALQAAGEQAADWFSRYFALARACPAMHRGFRSAA